MDDEGRWERIRRDVNERFSQIARAARELRHVHALRVLAKRRYMMAEGTPAPVVRLGVRFKREL